MSDTYFEETLRRIERKFDALFVSLERLTDAIKEATEHLEHLTNAKTEYVIGIDPSESINFDTVLGKIDKIRNDDNGIVFGISLNEDGERFLNHPSAD